MGPARGVLSAAAVPRPSRSWRPPFCPNADVRFPCNAGHLALQEEGLLRAAARSAPRPAVRLSFLPPELQFTDLLHHLLAQASAPSRRRSSIASSAARRCARSPASSASPTAACSARASGSGRHCLLVLEELRPRGAPDRAPRARRLPHLRAQPVLALRSQPPGRDLALRLRLQRRRAAPQRHAAAEPADPKRAELEAAHGRPHPQATRRAVVELVGAGRAAGRGGRRSRPTSTRPIRRPSPAFRIGGSPIARPRRRRAGRPATRSSRPTWPICCCATRARTTSARRSRSRSGGRARSTGRRSGRCGATS